MIKLSASITGIPAIQTNLSNKVNPAKVEQLLERTAILIEAEAKRMCPVGAPYGGRLQKSITHYKSGRLQYTISANTEYAEYVEYGTSRMMAGTPESPLIYVSGSGKYPSYRPFLRAALYGTMNRAVDYINSELGK